MSNIVHLPPPDAEAHAARNRKLGPLIMHLDMAYDMLRALRDLDGAHEAVTNAMRDIDGYAIGYDRPAQCIVDALRGIREAADYFHELQMSFRRQP